MSVEPGDQEKPYDQQIENTDLLLLGQCIGQKKSSYIFRNTH